MQLQMFSCGRDGRNWGTITAFATPARRNKINVGKTCPKIFSTAGIGWEAHVRQVRTNLQNHDFSGKGNRQRRGRALTAETRQPTRSNERRSCARFLGIDGAHARGLFVSSTQPSRNADRRCNNVWKAVLTFRECGDVSPTSPSCSLVV